jgi:hypothetical protein
MEDNDYTLGLETANPNPQLIPQITMESLGYLNTAAKWAKFLAILGFIGIGIMVLAGLAVGLFSTFSGVMQTTSHFPFPMGYLGFIYVIFAVVYVMPVIYLNNFSNNISKAVTFRETAILTEALLNLKRHLKYIGIMTIVMIATYIVVIIGVMIFAVTNSMHSF